MKPKLRSKLSLFTLAYTAFETMAATNSSAAHDGRVDSGCFDGGSATRSSNTEVSASASSESRQKQRLSRNTNEAVEGDRIVEDTECRYQWYDCECSDHVGRWMGCYPSQAAADADIPRFCRDENHDGTYGSCRPH